MEELKPEELEELVQELEGASGEEEALSPEVEQLLRDLQPDSDFAVRKRATEQLGNLGTSLPQIVSALITVKEFDKNHLIRTLATESLRAPVHQEILRQHPDLMQLARSAAEQAESQREEQGEKQREIQRAIEACAAESLSPEMEELLRDLQQASLWLTRKSAAERLGELRESSPRIVQSLVVVGKSDSMLGVRAAAMESLRAPVHQEILQEYPGLQHTPSATEKAATLRASKGAVQDRKESIVGWQMLLIITMGIVWVCIVSVTIASESKWNLLVALPGVAMVALGLWRWRSATINRRVLLRSSRWTDGTVEGKRKVEHKDEDGTSYTYYVTVLFEAEDAEMGTRVMALKASVSRDGWNGLRVGESVRILYAAEDPRIALIEGE